MFTNLARRKARAAATALGIALGVATIVALLSVGSGLKRTAGELVHLGQADLGIFQSGVSDPTASVLPASLAPRLEKRPDVAEATPLLLVIEGVKQEPAAVVFGARARRVLPPAAGDQRGARGPRRAHGILVGDKLASRAEAAPGLAAAGQEAALHRHRHLPLGRVLRGHRRDPRPRHRPAAGAPRRATRRPSRCSSRQDVKHAVAERALKRALPGTQILGTADDAERAGANGQLVRNVVTIIAALALIVGGLGVTNTMAMAVLERRRELALLSAVGWQRLRIAILVLAEGVAVSLVGAALGLLLGVVGAGLLNDALDVSAVVTPRVTLWTIGQGLLIGVAIGVFGGLYPAWRGTRGSAVELLGGT